MTFDQAVFPELRTERLTLRELTPADADRLYEIHGNADEMRWFGNDPMPSRRHALDFIEGLAADRPNAGAHLRWALVEHGSEGNELCGTCGLFSWIAGNRSCQIGYELHPEAQGRGLMTEALGEVLAFAFDVRNINRVAADIHPANKPSLALARGLGFVEEGVRRQVGFWGDRHHDLCLYSLLHEDWLRSRS